MRVCIVTTSGEPKLVQAFLPQPVEEAAATDGDRTTVGIAGEPRDVWISMSRWDAGP